MAGNPVRFKWELLNFSDVERAVTSDLFSGGGFVWKLKCHPHQDREPWTHVSVYLYYMFPHLNSATPFVTGAIKVHNHVDITKSVSRDFGKFDTGTKLGAVVLNVGCSKLIDYSRVTRDSGFLRDDGAMVIDVEFTVKVKAVSEYHARSGGSLSSDMLSLLANPGQTSDITINAGGCAFPAHRNILAARSEFFDALFRSGFNDSTARELPLQDVDADSMQLVMKYIYGGSIGYCPPHLLTRAADISERLLLGEARTLLEQQILAAADKDSIVDFLLWAESRGCRDLQAALEAFYVTKYAVVMSDNNLQTLATSSPNLMAKLHHATVKYLKANAK